jgi:hypothetical protein
MYKIKSKLAFKKFAGKCAFCEESNYAVLDVHRIVEGHRGGVYHSLNAVCVCANHHRMIHDGQIQIVKKHISYGESLYVLEYVQNEQTKLLQMSY